MSYGDIVTGIGTAVQDLFQSSGNAAQATDFNTAAQLAEQNAQLSAASTRIQETQTARQVTQSLGTQTADVASAGFTESGSALDLLASSASQGSLAKSLINIQGAMNENSYAAQSGAYKGEAEAANQAANASTIGAIASLGGALVNGSQQLISAGKTVVKGFDYLFGAGSGASVAGSAVASDAAITVGASGLGSEGVAATTDAFIGPGGAVSSVTDSAIANGADFSGYVASTNTAIDTSGTLGDLANSVSGAVSDAFSSIGSTLSSGIDSVFGAGVSDLIGAGLSDLIPGLGIVSMLGMIPGVSNIPVIGDVVTGIGDAVNTVVGGVVNVVSDIGSAIGGFFGSVICTALYKRGYLTRSVWHGAQKYGRDVAPEHVYAAYLMWGKPIARTIEKYPTFAMLVAPVFVPWAHELAILSGEKTAKSTLTGRVVFKVTYAFSALLGKAIMYKRSFHVFA